MCAPPYTHGMRDDHVPPNKKGNRQKAMNTPPSRLDCWSATPPSLRACLVGAASGSTSYTAGHAHALSEQPFRCGLGPSVSKRSGHRGHHVADCDDTHYTLRSIFDAVFYLSVAHRLPVALSAVHLSALADRVLPLHAVVPHRPLDAPLPSVARRQMSARWQRPRSERGHPRRAIREDRRGVR